MRYSPSWRIACASPLSAGLHGRGRAARRGQPGASPVQILEQEEGRKERPDLLRQLRMLAGELAHGGILAAAVALEEGLGQEVQLVFRVLS